MAIFGKKKASGDNGTEPPAEDSDTVVATGSDDSGEGPKYKPEPTKARPFFSHAQTSHDATNYEYAMQLWLRGLEFDPDNISSLEKFFTSAASFNASKDSKKSLSKETLKVFTGKTEVQRYLLACLNWSLKPMEAALAVRAADAAAKAGVVEPGIWIAERALGVVDREAKPRKDHYIKLMDVFSKLGSFDNAIRAGDAALRIDAGDGALGEALRNLAAQSTMSRGGYEDAGQEGGFRKNIKDLDKQRQLEEADRVTKTEDVVDRLVSQAAEAYRTNPEDAATVLNYVKRLAERGKDEDERRAFKVLSDAYEKTREFRFRKQAGEIKLRVARRRLLEHKAAAEKAAEAKAADADELRLRHAAANKQFLQMEIEEYEAWMKAYPTDLLIKYELGRRFFETGRYEDAIAQFQDSQNDAKYRLSSLNMLAQSFLQIAWMDEAVETFRRAIEAHRSPDDEVGMDLRYWLCKALMTRAEMRGDRPSAEEAEKIASSIAIRQINYRDIRDIREQVKAILGSL